MRRKLIVGILLTFMLALVLTGCGGSSAPTVKTLTVTGTVDDGTIAAGLGKSGKAAITGVTVSIYDFQTGGALGQPVTTDGSGNFSIANIPVGADLLIVVLVTDSESVVHRYSQVIAHVTLDNNHAVIDVISSAVAEVLGKLYNKGIDLDRDLINQIQTAIDSLPSKNFRCVPGEDFPADYGDDIPNADLSQIQIDQIMDTAYMKGMEIVNHMKFSLADFGVGAYKTYYLMPKSFYPVEDASYIVRNFIDYNIPDVVDNQKIFYLTPGTYTLEQVETAMVEGGAIKTGNWTLTWTDGSYSYRMSLTRTATSTSAQIFETYSDTEERIGTISYANTQTSSSSTLTADITIYGQGLHRTKKSKRMFEFDTLTASGIFTDSSRGLVFNGSLAMTYDNENVFSLQGRLAIGQDSISFIGEMDSLYSAFQGELTIGTVSIPNSPPGLSRVTADLKKFEFKSERDKRQEEPFRFTGKIDLRVTNAASLDWAAMYANGPTSTNSPVGTLTFSGSYISDGYSAGESFTSTFNQTAYLTGSVNTEFYYDLNNRKKININFSTERGGPLSLGITSTIGVNINIARAANDQFSGDVIVDNRTIGTVQPLTNECTINFIDGQSATIYSESF